MNLKKWLDQRISTGKYDWRLCDTSPNLSSDVSEQVFYVLSDKSIFHDCLPVHLQKYIFKICMLMTLIFLGLYQLVSLWYLMIISLYTFRIFSNSLMSLFWGGTNYKKSNMCDIPKKWLHTVCYIEQTWKHTTKGFGPDRQWQGWSWRQSRCHSCKVWPLGNQMGWYQTSSAC